MYPDPFRRGDNILVLSECYNSDGTPNKFNYRAECAKLMEKHKEHDPWFGLEQEYTLFNTENRPYGWPQGGFPGPQGPYYCGVGTGKVYARDIVEAHYKACLYTGVKISGINAEVMPSQWEFQVGPCQGIEMGDHLWMARYLLERIAEEFGVKISLHPKPLEGDWNGAGCHTNVSTVETRKPGTGMQSIEECIAKLEKKHKEHIMVYGSDNDKRLTGRHETGHIDSFSSGVANRGASIRIPRQCAKDGYGYFEDRRPASNIGNSPDSEYKLISQILIKSLDVLLRLFSEVLRESNSLAGIRGVVSHISCTCDIIAGFGFFGGMMPEFVAVSDCHH
jgi:glutamine synthetase